jgi:hypothetical protein
LLRKAVSLGGLFWLTEVDPKPAGVSIEKIIFTLAGQRVNRYGNFETQSGGV